MALEPAPLTSAIESYVAAVAHATKTTTSSRDREVFEQLHADGERILNLVKSGADSESLLYASGKHQRIWNRMWLEDPVYETPWQLWRTISDHVGNAI